MIDALDDEILKREIQPLISNLTGLYQLSTGVYVPAYFDCSPIPKKFHILSTLERQSQIRKVQNLLANLDELPIIENSIDFFVVSFLLEKQNDHSLFLEEIYRVLVPGGKVLFIGINQSRIRRLFNKKQAPTKQTYNQICQKIYNTGFSIVTKKTFIFQSLITKIFIFEKLAYFLFPSSGNFYYILASKETPGMTPLQLNWQHKMIFSSDKVTQPISSQWTIHDK